MLDNKPNVKSRLDSIAKSTKQDLTPFQRATVDYVAALYRKGINRILVADEVGLGKTLVARGAVAEVARLRCAEKDDLVKIAYVCSNGAIASQNIERLRIDAQIKLADSSNSRLSMQHLELAREVLDDDLANRYIQIIPLTPQTSFELGNSIGKQAERALVFAVLRHEPVFAKDYVIRNRLKKLLWYRNADSKKENWEGYCNKYSNDVKELMEKGASLSKKGKDVYPFDLIERVKLELDDDLGRLADNFKHTPISFKDLVEHLKSNNFDRSFARDVIISLRRAFSKASIDFMEPDFVIMDEFQRFKNLIAKDDSEASLLANRFFSGKVRILLLSATPFKMYSTKAEDEDGSFGDSYKEFLDVICFLADKDDRRYSEFLQIWTDYSRELSAALGDEAAIVRCRERKEAAQDMAASFIARTERTSTGELQSIADNKNSDNPVVISAGDIKSFHAARRLMAAAQVPEGLMDADYSKSCPYPFSFMRDYLAKKSLDRSARKDWSAVEKAAKQGSKQLWVSRNDIRLYKRLKVDNARYQQLEHDIFDEVAASQLLWVPASMPYYKPPAASVFSKARHFSKTLIFSSWAMVPPALSTLLSYEAERRNVQKLDAEYQYFKDSGRNEETDTTALPQRRMLFTRARQNVFPLVYPSPYLASLFNNREPATEVTLSDLRRSVRQRIEQDLARAIGVPRLPRGIRASRDIDWYAMATFALDEAHLGDNYIGWKETLLDDIANWSWEQTRSILATMEDLYEKYEDWSFDEHLREMPADIASVLADAAIGAPSVCAYRSYKDFFKGDLPAVLPFEFGIAFVRRMNTSAATLAVAAAMGERGSKKMRSTHWKQMLSYSCEGNLQAVLDEYVHMESMGKVCFSEDELADLHARVVGISDEDNEPTLHNAESNHVIETFDSFKANTAEQSRRRRNIVRLRTNFANAFMETKDESLGNVSRDKKRAAFNSPFWPFILVSTSIGQEGLDFHQYCRKIVHWNLPSNPIDLEQREGRINRYKGLVIRQNVADRYSNKLSGKDSAWNELFEIAAQEEVKRSGLPSSSGLLPYWGVTDSDNMVKIERYVYSYPFSKDELRYQYLLETVRKYRAVLGQPDQEDLLALLEKRFGNSAAIGDNFSALFLNLSPFVREQ